MDAKYILSIVFTLLLWLTTILLYAFSVIGLIGFLVCFIVSTMLMILFIILYVKYRKRRIEKLRKIEAIKIVSTEDDIIRLYNLAGIPILRDENGKIKNIYELLKLEAQYDPNGKRIRTIYEMLGIVPRFDKNGNEIPTIMSIKNRVNGFIKPTKKSTLTRVLTDKEKEDLLLKQMLQEKLKQAKEQGDEKKAKTIKKVINDKKKEAPKKSSKPSKIIMATGKSIGATKIKAIKPQDNKNLISDIMSLFSGSPKKSTSAPVAVEQNKKEQTIKREGFSILRPEEMIGQSMHRDSNAFQGSKTQISRTNSTNNNARGTTSSRTFMGTKRPIVNTFESERQS